MEIAAIVKALKYLPVIMRAIPLIIDLYEGRGERTRIERQELMKDAQEDLKKSSERMKQRIQDIMEEHDGNSH